MRINVRILLICGIGAFALFALPQIVFAQGGDNPLVDNKACLSCHSTPDMYKQLSSGDVLYLTIDQSRYEGTEHGEIGYQCVQCHSDISEYPHPEIQAETSRDYSLEMYELCSECHEMMYDQTLDSTHQKALAGGNENAAVCTDCHDPHYMTSPGEPRSNVATICRECHSEIYNEYEESVHGGALINEGDPNVPTCIDCHGVHNVAGPSTIGNFHLFSPLLCAHCHADEEMMDPYGVSTDVFQTYISDFHGTTVLLFEETTPDQQTNKPVCVDCHGVHNMKMVDDPESQVMKENLLITCQKCHPDATSSFPDSWLNHYSPSPDKYPLVYYVGMFYKIIIPVTIGGMLVFIGSDIWKKVSSKLEERND